MGFNLMVMLCSTTGSYGRPMIEVSYREKIFHSTEAIWEMVVREEWLECCHDVSPMFDISRSTPVWAPYILFFDFLVIKAYIYCFKSICSIKEHWWSLILS